MEKYFFDIPIYRCSREKHTQELYKAKKKVLQFMIDLNGIEVKNSSSYESLGNRYDFRFWYPWRYNEIIGWIRLYALGDQARGDLWFSNAKKIRSNLKNKRIFCRGKAFERTILKNQSSTDIFHTICEELAVQEKEPPIKGRYLDKNMFYYIGKFINWRQIFSMED